MARIKKVKRQYTKKNTAYWQKDAEYNAYFKEFTKINRQLKKIKVDIGTKWKQGLFVAGKVEEFDVKSAKLMNKIEFQRYRKKYGEDTGISIAQDQFNLLSDKVATKVQEGLRRAGITKPDGTEYSLLEIKARQLPQEIWEKMELAANEADSNINEYFFGS